MREKKEQDLLTEAQIRTAEHMIYVAGWKQYRLADEIGISESAVSRLLNERKPIGRDAQLRLAAIARPFGVRFIAEAHDPSEPIKTNGIVDDEVADGAEALGMARSGWKEGQIGKARAYFAHLLRVAAQGMAECDARQYGRPPIPRMNHTTGAVRSPASQSRAGH